MRLDLWKISIVEVSRVFQIHVPKCNDTTSLVAHCQELSRLIEGNCCQNIWICNIFEESFSKAIDVDPISVILMLIGTIWWLPSRWLPVAYNSHLSLGFLNIISTVDYHTWTSCSRPLSCWICTVWLTRNRPNLCLRWWLNFRWRGCSLINFHKTFSINRIIT